MFVLLLVLRAFSLAVRAAPLSLGRILEVWVQTHQMVSARARVAQNDFTTLLTRFTVVLVLLLLKIIKKIIQYNPIFAFCWDYFTMNLFQQNLIKYLLWT